MKKKWEIATIVGGIAVVLAVIAIILYFTLRPKKPPKKPPCVPNCKNKNCGPDGCKGTCGTCKVGYTCKDGKCVCVPNCKNKNCGSDGCKGTCGTCKVGYTCKDGKCVCVPNCKNKTCGSDGCGGTCPPGCPAGQSCSPDGTKCVSCVPNCKGKTCGEDDGCVDKCRGTCPGSQYCDINNTCQDFPEQPGQMRITNYCKDPSWISLAPALHCGTPSGKCTGVATKFCPQGCVCDNCDDCIKNCGVPQLNAQNQEILAGKFLDLNIPSDGLDSAAWHPMQGCVVKDGALTCSSGQSTGDCKGLPNKTCEPPYAIKWEGTWIDPKNGGGVNFDNSLVGGWSLPINTINSVPAGGSCVNTECLISFDDCPTDENLLTPGLPTTHYDDGYGYSWDLGNMDLRVWSEYEKNPNIQAGQPWIPTSTAKAQGPVGCLAPCQKLTSPAPWGPHMVSYQPEAKWFCCPAAICACKTGTQPPGKLDCRATDPNCDTFHCSTGPGNYKCENRVITGPPGECSLPCSHDCKGDQECVKKKCFSCQCQDGYDCDLKTGTCTSTRGFCIGGQCTGNGLCRPGFNCDKKYNTCVTGPRISTKCPTTCQPGTRCDPRTFKCTIIDDNGPDGFKSCCPDGYGCEVPEGQKIGKCVSIRIENPECNKGPVVKTQYVQKVRENCPSVYSFAYDDFGGDHACTQGTKINAILCPTGKYGK